MNYINSHQHILLCKHWSRFAHHCCKQDHTQLCKCNCPRCTHPGMLPSPMSTRSMDFRNQIRFVSLYNFMTKAHISTSCFTGIWVSTSIFTTYRIILLRAHTGLSYTSNAKIGNVEENDPCHFVTGNRLAESTTFQAKWLMSIPDLLRPFQKLPASTNCTIMALNNCSVISLMSKYALTICLVYVKRWQIFLKII